MIPRYGDEILGGAEAQAREQARGLAARGHEIEVLTTCAVDHNTWANDLPPGPDLDGEVKVRRFSTVSSRDEVGRSRIERRIFSREALEDGEELAWINSRFAVPDLYLYLAGSATSYDAIIYSPYLFWTTLYCIELAPERSILVPCLHDEPYAYLRSVRAALAGSAAVWFLSEPEHQLGHRLASLPPHRVIGSAVRVPEGYDPTGFAERHGLERSFVLYAGRRELGKGWPQALRGYGAALVRHALELDLVTIGVGEPEIPPALDRRVIDLGQIETAEVGSAFAAARACIQPSPNESFSRMIMESWLAGTAVIANSASEVVSWHCERSGGGLLYADEIEMGQCLRLFSEEPKLADELAARGREYVLSNYTWPRVLDAMEAELARFV